MPISHLRYKLTLDATVSLLELNFDGYVMHPVDLSGATFNYPTRLYVLADTLPISLALSGPAGAWTIEVEAIRIDDDGNEYGGWKPLAQNGTATFRGDVSSKNSLIGFYKINWKP